MKKTFLKTGMLALFLLFGLTQSAWAQTIVDTGKDDAGVVSTTTIVKTFETANDDITVEVQDGTVKYKMYSLAAANGSKWKEIKSGEVAEGVDAKGNQIPKKLTLSAKGSQKFRVEVTLDADENATMNPGKL